MGIIFTATFWSVVLILLGIGIILNVIFGTRIPFLRILLGLLLCYIGISLLLGQPLRRGPCAWFEKPTTGTSGQHNVVFGELTVDLSRRELPAEPAAHEVNVVFGNGCVKLNPHLPVRIEVNSVFGSVRLPDGTRLTFGEQRYQTRDFDPTRPYLRLKANVVFGTLRFVNTPQPDDTLEAKGGL